LSNYGALQRREKFPGTLFDSPVNTATPPSFFEVRWQIFLTAERLLRSHDVEHLRRVQRNILDCELRRIDAATQEKQVAFSFRCGFDDL